MAYSVPELFVNEKPELYYEPGYTSYKTVNGQKVGERKNCSVLLHNSYLKLRDYFRKAQLIKVSFIPKEGIPKKSKDK